MLKIFKKGGEKQDVFLKLEEDKDAIYLTAFSEKVKTPYYLIMIDKKTLKIIRFSSVSPELGFKLDDRGKLIIN